MSLELLILVDGVRHASCQCAGSWTGEQCEISPCASKPCYPGVHCSLSNNSLSSQCGACPTRVNMTDPVLEGDGRTCTRTLSATLSCVCSDFLLFKAALHNFHSSFLSFIAMNSCGNNSYNITSNCQFREYCRVNFAKPEYYECECPPNFKQTGDGINCINSFCKYNPDACGDSTTECTNTNASDPNEPLHTCG